jgi:hypothetical protein
MFADVVNGADIGMVERRGGSGFALEALPKGRIVNRALREDLDRHVAPQPRVMGAIDFTRAA